jgi:hypothetical protein
MRRGGQSAYPALDRLMILFQNIVEILHRSVVTVFLQSVLGFEPHDGWRVCGVLVSVDNPRAGWTGFNPKTQQKIRIQAKTVLKFRVAKVAKDAVLGVEK